MVAFSLPIKLFETGNGKTSLFMIGVPMMGRNKKETECNNV